MDSRRRLNPLLQTVDSDDTKKVRKSGMKEQSSVTLLKDKARPYCYVRGTMLFTSVPSAYGYGTDHVHVATDVGRLHGPRGAS